MPAWDGSSAEVPTGGHSSRNHSACLRVPVLWIAGPSPERGLSPRQALDKQASKKKTKPNEVKSDTEEKIHNVEDLQLDTEGPESPNVSKGSGTPDPDIDRYT